MIAAWGIGVLLIAAVWFINKNTSQKIGRSVDLFALIYTVAFLAYVSQWLFFPQDHLGLFTDALGRNLQRTTYTNAQNSIVVAWWAGAMLVAALQRDRFTLMAGGLVGSGFGIGFAAAALWCLCYGFAPGSVDWPRLFDWWKVWELNSGFNLGALYVITMYWAVRQLDKSHDAAAPPLSLSSSTLWCETAAMAAAGFLMIYVMAREYFSYIGIGLSVFFVALLCLATLRTDRDHDARTVVDRRRGMLIAYTAFLLLFIMIRGGTSTLGLLLGLYDAAAVNQYAWPRERVILFIPAGILLVGIMLFNVPRILRGPGTLFRAGPQATRLSLRLVDLMTLTTVVAAVSIWPAKIGALYAACLGLALFAFNRLNQRFNDIDDSADIPR